ncbi:MAG: PQQ-binding-like beta-propeller repeat protein [Propionibacteriales bacterium]|nr:PQQ-binding-like beta-propeller repeat protein [Propionibacteriales bacterium]
MQTLSVDEERHSAAVTTANAGSLRKALEPARLGSVPATGSTFAQPVFADGLLFVASEDGTISAYGP